MPFRAQQLSVNQSQGIHEYRKGKIATFFDELYQDWIIPHIVKEINKGQKFLADLDSDEFDFVRRSIAENFADFTRNEQVLSAQLPSDKEELKKQFMEDFTAEGTRRFLKLLEKELKDAPVSIRLNISGKMEDLVGRVDKLVNIFRQIIAAPQILQNPAMAKIFNQILESSGISPVDFAGFSIPTPAPTPALPGAMPARSPEMMPVA